ncbi:tRNA (N(6)-L-threonylcarbamoyladenosine(37)-C(2))-methylthiotransferase MtaB [Thermodesulfobacteriota bacterium]
MDREIKRAAVYTLGCKVNAFESMAMKEQLERFNIEVVPPSDRADLYIINSCTVTSKTDAESRRIIKRLKRLNSDSLIAVTGCYAQLKGDELKELDDVDYVIPNTEKKGIVEHILSTVKSGDSSKNYLASDILSEKKFLNLEINDLKDRDRAFLKIQDGCDSYCSYCIVPYARGHVRSMEFDDVIRSINRFVELGFKEVVLSGIHVGKYGADLTKSSDLLNLIKGIENSTDLKRLRISSIEPNEITDDFIEHARSSKILCNHYHIPLQSGDDEVLTMMNRKYSTNDFSLLLKKLKDTIEDVIIGADVIVGFPGETDNSFDNTVTYIKESQIDYLHVFRYSKREGTKAHDMPGHVDEQTKKKRAALLREISADKKLAAYNRFISKRVKVLFERKPNKESGFLKGLTTNYLTTIIKDFSEDMFNSEAEPAVSTVERIKNQPFLLL